tara:strand:- start:399 stop:1358 length:960 start_codon:yes stop_codon:yes gene_type:complete
MFAKNTSDYLRILGSNPYDKGNTSQICTACISIFDASEELDASTYNLYREKSKISPKIFSKLKVIGKGLSKLTKSDRRDVIKRLPESYSTIHVLFSLKPEEVVTGVKRGDITPSLSIRSAKDYVARVKYPAKFALDGEKGKWGYKQENLFKIVRQQDQVLSEELLLDLKDELRKICTKYGVNIQDANAKGVETLRKQERSEKGVFWRLILEKELDQKWFKGADESIKKQFNIKNLQELHESPIRTFTGFIIKVCGSKETFWKEHGRSYVAKLNMLSEVTEDHAQRYNYRKRIEQVLADPRGRNLAIWNNQILMNSGYLL